MASNIIIDEIGREGRTFLMMMNDSSLRRLVTFLVPVQDKLLLSKAYRVGDHRPPSATLTWNWHICCLSATSAKCEAQFRSQFSNTKRKKESQPCFRFTLSTTFLLSTWTAMETVFPLFVETRFILYLIKYRVCGINGGTCSLHSLISKLFFTTNSILGNLEGREASLSLSLFLCPGLAWTDNAN